MSTFGGLIAEIPGISIDRFDGDNLDSKVYFLSHCHTDHMQGLWDESSRKSFIKQLVDDEKCLYLSHVSCGILKNLYDDFRQTEPSKCLIEIDLNSTTLIEIDANQFINCTPITAGHCPGSVMFLFETKNHTILYTGDFRIKPTDLCKFNGFYNSSKQLKSIDKIYMDTTFFLKSHKTFPSRDDSVETICNLIKEWTEKNNKNIVNLSVCAKYGYEFLFMEIYKNLKYPVHVNRENYNFYRKVPEMDNCVTCNGNQTPIHSACVSFYKICQSVESEYLRTIRISAMSWTNDSLNTGGIFKCGNPNKFNVCYSTHASHDECVGLINFLRPKAIEPNVLSHKSDDIEEIHRNIKLNLKMINNNNDSDTDSESSDASES